MIRVVTPVTADGSTDMSRQVLYIGEAQLLRQVGPLPLAFEIETHSLGKAAERFAVGAKVAVERAVRELQELRREAASPIIVPPTVAPGLGGPGGTRGSGKDPIPAGEMRRRPARSITSSIAA